MDIKIDYQKNIYIPEWLLKELGGNRLLAGIMLQRGIDTVEKVREFLDPTYYQPTSPFEFPDMEEAVELILETVQKGGKICIYGDYDVDGVVSTVILVELIKKLGGDVKYHIPDRYTEGYGINRGIIRELAQEVELIISCDCGISNYEEVLLAKELGLKVIVTDHHQLPDKLPPADFIISPKLLPEDHKAFNIPGAGMAYFLALAVLRKLGREEETSGFLELLSLAIIADVVPLQGENRYLLQKGLPLLSKPGQIGLSQLFRTAGISDKQEITEEDIAFRIAPMINSAGRIYKAALAVDLFLTDNRFTAEKYALELETLNRRRKKLQNEVIDEAVELLKGDPGRKAIVLYQPHWSEGVIGIAAGRLSEEYQLPVLLMCQKDDGQTISGSVRSIPGIHIYQELKKCEKFLTKYGGHAGAAGFSLEKDKLSLFIKSISTLLLEKIDKKRSKKVFHIDGELAIDKVELQDYYDLRRLAPFGEGNPVPRFISYSTELIHSRATSDQRHLRLIFGKNAVQYPAVWWWAGEKELADKVDLIYFTALNDFRGKKQLQLMVEEIIPVGEEIDSIIDRDSLIREERRIQRDSADFEVIDLRNWKERGEILPLFKEAVYYYEGLEEFKDIEIINRYQMTKNKTLVLLSCPPSLEILKELLYLNHPSKLVLAYSKSDTVNGKGFIKKLSGLVKYSIQEKKSQLDIYQIAAKTGQMESTIIAGLEYLEAKGFINLNSFNPRFFVIRIGGESTGGNWRVKERELIELIRESISFKSYFAKINLDRIKYLIQEILNLSIVYNGK